MKPLFTLWLTSLCASLCLPNIPCAGAQDSADPARLGLYANHVELLAQAPSVQDLGFSAEQTQGNVQDQATLDKRSHMLKIHQRLGLITTAPLIATLLLAPGNKSSSSDRALHGGLGLVTAGMYFTTASYAIRAPEIPGVKEKGMTQLHKALAWIHGPGMILTPILGAMADEQRNAGQKVHGIASAHGVVASMTIAA